jgi:hypothetical protein
MLFVLKTTYPIMHSCSNIPHEAWQVLARLADICQAVLRGLAGLANICQAVLRRLARLTDTRQRPFSRKMGLALPNLHE